jgi:ribonuclease Z
MDNVKITFLGTGSSIPTKHRNHTAILLDYKSEHILVDCGEGTQRQFRMLGLNPGKINRILITHWHGDHTLGLLGLMQTLAMSDYSGQLKIYGPRGTKSHFSFLEHFMSNYSFSAIKLEIHEVHEGVFVDEPNFRIEAKALDHGVPALSYSFIIKDRRRLITSEIKKNNLPHSSILKDLQQGKDIVFNGKKIRAKDLTYIEKGKKISFVFDSAYTEDILGHIKNSDILIAESTYLNEEKEMARDHKHMTASQAALLAKKAKVKKLVLTHLSQRYEHKKSEVLKESKKIFKNTSIACDFDVLEI